ncbi:MULTISPECIES: hypothetical protein [unclassified Pseudomonas]|uniref:hypothetical protein n=1 Tax=unclassified Pseudomonas TaxID=196821 RepID=UPI00128BAEC1|nr:MULTISPECIES: hypothetical protein [unclassified Pseudomonas]MPQ71568.1 hypothetical protein [Pseudomonas sp. MWU12-2323]
MIDFKSLVEGESVKDIISFLAGSEKGIDYRSLDRFFVRYRFDVVEKGELLSTVREMGASGVIQQGEHPMTYIKGPNWKEPAFVAENKYFKVVKLGR